MTKTKFQHVAQSQNHDFEDMSFLLFGKWLLNALAFSEKEYLYELLGFPVFRLSLNMDRQTPQNPKPILSRLINKSFENSMRKFTKPKHYQKTS